ncbi:MAG TPA: hypothetical protein VFF67_00645 [Thermoplasmata archaeon]|nr:hypothetical protein [Thermoplasmata archaeon]
MANRSRPAASVPGPRNESELLHQRPGAHLDGIFPRSLLLPGERVLYESRPRLWGFRRVSLSVVIAFAAFFALIALSAAHLSGPASAPGAISPALAGGLIGAGDALITVVLLLPIVLGWQRSGFAITQQRVLAVSGLSSSFRFAVWQDVERLVAPRGDSGAMVFQIVRRIGGGRTEVGTVRWPAVPHAPAVYQFVQTAFALRETSRLAEAKATLLRERIISGRVACPYCGNLVDREAVGGLTARCPRCTAPLDAAGPAPALSRPPGPRATPELGYRWLSRWSHRAASAAALDRAARRRRERRIAAAIGAVGLIVVAGVAVVTWSASNGTPQVVPGPAPIVMVQSGSVWSIPPNHFEYQRAAVHRNGSLEGSFTASAPVSGYVMDANSYAVWQAVGRVVYDQYATRNVTSAAFDTFVHGSDWWYVVVVPESNATTVDVTWATTCQVVFT